MNIGILGWTGLISLQSKGLSRVFFSITVWKHQFFRAQPSLWSNSHIHTWLLEKPQIWLYGPLLAKWCLCFITCCLGLSQHSFQEARICNHHLQWFFSPRKENLSLFPLFSLYLPWSDGTRCHDLRFLNVDIQASFFTLLFHPHQEILELLFTFCY